MTIARSKSVEATRSRPPLDRRRIAVAALALIDDKGIEQLSMRSIGAALDVEAMALYYYFGNKADLLEAVRDHLLEQLAAGMPQDGSPLQRVRAAFEALRQLGLQHPGVVATLGSCSFRSDAALRYYEKLMEALFAAGLTPQQSARYFSILTQFTVGACLFSPRAVALPGETPEQRDADFRFGLDLILQQLHGERQAAEAQS